MDHPFAHQALERADIRHMTKIALYAGSFDPPRATSE